jgi:hypothetical protein
MKLLVSWSGPTSNEIAKAFRKWINMINQSIEPYMSEEDIEKGSRWSAGLSRQLEQTNYGVIVLTPENTKSEWLHFEAGAIARSVDESRVSPILIGLKPLDVRLPLSQFQLTEFHKQDVWKLVKSINTAAGAGAKSDELLQRMFEALWPKFEEEVVSLAKNLTAPQPAASVPLLDTILQELLTLVRQQARILANPADVFGKEVLNLLVRLTYEEGTALRLTANERHLALALTARWEDYIRQFELYLSTQEKTDRSKQVAQGLGRLKQYLLEFRKVLLLNPKTIDVAELPTTIAADLASPKPAV